MQHLQPNTTLQGGKYRIERMLGQGGFGITYLAHNTVLDVNVTIKEFFLKEDNIRDDNIVITLSSTKSELFLGQKEKFKKEAKRMSAIKNEHVISVFDLFEENGTAYYVMDYVDGENLSDRLKRTGHPMTESEVRLILPQILDALKAVHDADIWHLDLKPANIMIDKAGNIKLIDFGASKQLNAQKGGATTSTAISYTNGYAPREQMEQNYEKFGPWTDLYALGATLYNLLTKRRPPLPTDMDDDMSEDKHLSLPMPTSVSDGMKKIILRLMQTNRNRRPQTVNELIDNLTLLNGTPEEGVHISEDINRGTDNEDDQEKTILDNPNSNNRGDADVESQPEGGSADVLIDDKEERSFKQFYWVLALLVLIGGLCFYKCSNAGADYDSPSRVESYYYETDIGGCKYTGPVDDFERPHGDGEAYFDDGRYYRGHFEDGVLTGSAFFKYPNGDTFEGEFRYNSFYQGVYTIAEDGSSFHGKFENGKPKESEGHWEDKNGNVIK